MRDLSVERAPELADSNSGVDLNLNRQANGKWQTARNNRKYIRKLAAILERQQHNSHTIYSDQIEQIFPYSVI